MTDKVALLRLIDEMDDDAALDFRSGEWAAIDKTSSGDDLTLDTAL